MGLQSLTVNNEYTPLLFPEWAQKSHPKVPGKSTIPRYGGVAMMYGQGLSTLFTLRYPFMFNLQRCLGAVKWKYASKSGHILPTRIPPDRWFAME